MSERTRTKAFAEVMVWAGLTSLLFLAVLGGYALAGLAF